MPSGLAPAAATLNSDRHRLLGADHGDRHDRDAGPHGDLDEAAAAEAAQPVALAVGLARALGALGEHEHELAAARAAGGRRCPGGRRTPPTRDHSVPTTGSALEDVVGQAVDRPPELGLDAVHDHRGVRRDGAGVVGDEQRAALGRDVLEALPLGPEPAFVDRIVQPAGHRPHVLGAAPLVDVALPRVSKWLPDLLREAPVDVYQRTTFGRRRRPSGGRPTDAARRRLLDRRSMVGRQQLLGRRRRIRRRGRRYRGLHRGLHRRSLMGCRTVTH